MQVIQQILRIILECFDAYKKYISKKRTDAIHSKPADEWLHKFGGNDKRSSTTDSEISKLDNNE